MEIQNYLNDFIQNTLKHFGVRFNHKVEQTAEGLVVVIDGDNLNFLIGHHGSSINALQHLVSLALFNKFNEWHFVSIDVNGYREKKKDKLHDIAKHFIDKVRFFNKEAAMSPMPSADRRVIHEFISDYDDVESFSIGDGFDRHIIIKPKN